MDVIPMLSKYWAYKQNLIYVANDKVSLTTNNENGINVSFSFFIYEYIHGYDGYTSFPWLG